MIIEILNPVAEKRGHCVKALDICMTRQCFGYEEALRLAGKINLLGRLCLNGNF